MTRSVLASEIYGMVAGFDVAFVLAETLKTVMKQLGMPSAPLLVYTDSLSLYQCLVRLGTTVEKRLMITSVHGSGDDLCRRHGPLLLSRPRGPLLRSSIRVDGEDEDATYASWTEVMAFRFHVIHVRTWHRGRSS